MNTTATSAAARDQETLDRILAGAGAHRVLLRGASVISMDPQVGDLAAGDVLIDGAVIAAVGPDLSDAAADGQSLVVDAGGAVIIPGLVDTHRHCWQTQFRRLIPDTELPGYLELMHARLGPAYEPEDMYLGNLLAALGAVDSGTTCVLDFSHNSRSPRYSDEAIRAWKDSGVRAVFASCVPLFGDWDPGWRDDLTRLRGEHFSSDDQPLTLRMGLGARVMPLVQGDLLASPENLAHARELGIGVTVDAVFGPAASEHIVELGQEGALGPDVTWIHCTDLSDDAWRALADSGGAVALAVTSDEQLGCQDGIPPIQRAVDAGILPGLSVDVECCLSTDMFTQMQVALNTQRMQAATRRHAGDEHAPAPIPVRDVLEYATVGGAKANGVWDRCGSITPGKQADLVLIDATSIGSLPLNNAVGTVVLGGTRDVDTVFVAGQPRKWAGELVGIDVARVRQMVTESRDRLLERIGYDLDIVA